MTALTTRAIETMGERIVKRLDAAAASVSRDALAKNLYAKLFDWLVAAINRKISAIGRHSSRCPVMRVRCNPSLQDWHFCCLSKQYRVGRH